MYLKLVILIFFTAISLSVYGQNENYETKNIDLFATAGVFFLNDLLLEQMSMDNSKRDLGIEVSVSGLYSFQRLGIMNPVVGTGIHSSYFNNNIDGYQSTIAWTGIEANGGVKFNLSSWFRLFTLFNIGYSVADKIYQIDGTASIKPKIKNHAYAGATVIGTIPLTSAMSLGGSVSFNKHFNLIKYYDKSFSYYQFTAALVLQYSI